MNKKGQRRQALPSALSGLRFLIRCRRHHHAFMRRFRNGNGAGRFISFARMLASLRRISGRRTIISIAPFSIRNSLRWNPGGSFSRTVCSITRGPAKPISAFGSAMFRSPSIAKLADTPPMVGSVSTEMYGSPRSCIFASAAEVFAICISDISASCIRAPPEAEKQISGQLSSSACSTARTKRAPTTEPIDPPHKGEFKGGGNHRHRVESTFHHHQRVFLARLFLSRRQAVFVFF